MKIKTENEVTLQFPSQSSNEGFIRSAVACFAAQMDPTLNELEDIKTAVSEAATNAIVHAYPDRIGKVTVKVRTVSYTHLVPASGRYTSTPPTVL